MTVWNLVKEFIELDNEILQLVDEKTKKKADANRIDKEIDRKLCRQLEIKHCLENISL